MKNGPLSCPGSSPGISPWATGAARRRGVGDKSIDSETQRQRERKNWGRQGSLSPWPGPSGAEVIASCQDPCKEKEVLLASLPRCSHQIKALHFSRARPAGEAASPDVARCVLCSSTRTGSTVTAEQDALSNAKKQAGSRSTAGAKATHLLQPSPAANPSPGPGTSTGIPARSVRAGCLR